MPNALNGHHDTASITGLEAHLGRGAPEARGFWADAWHHVLHRPAAIFALTWIGVVAFFAVAAPLLASGHPLILRQLDESGETVSRTFPLFAHLRTADWLLLVGSIAALVIFIVPWKAPRSHRLGVVIAGGMQAGVIAALAQLAHGFFGARDAPNWARTLEQGEYAWMPGWLFVPALVSIIGVVVSVAFAFIPSTHSMPRRVLLVCTVAIITAVISALTWSTPPERFEYDQMIRQGEASALWTLVPWSPAQRPGERDAKLLPPGSSVDQALARQVITGLSIRTALSEQDIDKALARIEGLSLPADQRAALRASVTDWLNRTDEPTRAQLRTVLMKKLAGSGRHYVLGSDAFGQDVLSQLLHASRLAISIGFVSTSIAVFIGITLGALMGYFGGLVDLVLYRVVEIFMAVPLLFILIVAAGVLPRNTYVMMVIIGCFTWTNAARYTRAEFLKLRNQDFVQAARGVGLPLRSVLFRHMLPNGVTPVLVDASFAIAFAIILEATLSFLGLGPADQASWGRLLADATNEVGQFLWWLAIFPGMAIFLAALSYNMLGEALRDAIDPKRKKARV